MFQAPRLITLRLALLFPLPKDVIEAKVYIECTGTGDVFTFVVFFFFTFPFARHCMTSHVCACGAGKKRERDFYMCTGNVPVIVV